MSKVYIAESSQTLEAVLLKRQEIGQNHSYVLELRDYVVLREGPIAYKVAVRFLRKDRLTGAKIPKSHVVKIETYLKYSKAGWHLDGRHTITLDEDEGAKEALRLATFLGAIRGAEIPDLPGNYLVIPVDNNQLINNSVPQLLNTILANSNADIVAEAVTEVLSAVAGDIDVLKALVREAAENPEASRGIAAALNIARFSDALATLEKLIAQDAKEGLFQAHLEKNPWIFGSEYSKLLDRRNFTTDEQQDFAFRRTVDGYLEIIEIKRPLKQKPLFIKDESHNTLYPRSELSEVLGQVFKYIEEMDTERNGILRKYHVDANKVRVKVIIGCINDNDKEQLAALRRFNGHLHRVEIITFDQLVRIARQVLEHLQNVISPLNPDL